MRRISLFGATGSIGTQTLDVVTNFPGCGVVTAMVAGRFTPLLMQHVVRHRPEVVGIACEADAVALTDAIRSNGLRTHVISGATMLAEMAMVPADVAVMAIPGTAAIGATATLIQQGVTIALATKEVLVSAGQWIMALAAAHEVSILPVDSEHAAIAQCLMGGDHALIKRVILTASGGPFRTRPDLSGVTVADALAHPKWQMGPKITIDSATLMNKGLEVIEAHHLFGLPMGAIDVVVHPQSMVHGMVEWVDGQWVAHLSPTDMRYPIQYALTHPNRLPTPWPTMAFPMGTLTFESPDWARFPLLGLAYECGRQGGSAPVILNAANEVMVGCFLAGQCGFLDIFHRVSDAVAQYTGPSPQTIDEVVALDLEIKQRLQCQWLPQVATG